MRVRSLTLLLFSLIIMLSCKKDSYDAAITANTSLIHQAINTTTELIVHDIFSPVVAGRIYAYSTIALYEGMRLQNPAYKSLAGQLNELTEIPSPPADTDIDFNVAGLHAYISVAKALIFSEADMEEFRQEIYAGFVSKGFPPQLLDDSKAYGQVIADHIIAWTKTDNYGPTRSATKYTVNKEPGRWVPTPPAFMEGVEPNWRLIRPMTLDSANQFVPLPHTPFSADKNSEFYRQAREVYDAVASNTEDKLAIASFWDCNPYVMHQQGHLMFATKKITPGGHWMGIVGLASRKAGLDMVGTAEAYALTAIGLYDGFISCWDEKYRSNLIRPETYINRYIDPEWVPTLQTPPFPEHTSGHSVISSSSTVILSHLFGDSFAFADSTEVPYGLPVRQYTSFKEAANEASISRFYGGIHYMPAIEYGVGQGTKVGEHVIASLKTRN